MHYGVSHICTNTHICTYIYINIYAQKIYIHIHPQYGYHIQTRMHTDIYKYMYKYILTCINIQ